MDRRIRILAVVLIGCFGLLFLQLNNLQVRQAKSLQDSPYTPDTGASPWNEQRGAIVTSDGVEIAYSQKTAAGYERVYPDGSLFADVTGYYDETQYAAPLGLEASYNDDLLPHEQTAKNLKGLLTERTGTDTIETTISARLQKVAAEALGSLDGAVIAMDPQTGAVLAMYSNPTYNPNELSTLTDPKKVASYYAKLEALGGASPLVNGVTRQRGAPGSTFKIITTSTIYDNNETSIAQKVWPYLTSTPITGTNKLLDNFDSESCGGDLANILAVSCDTAYALIGLELGPTKLAGEAEKFGFNKTPPIDLPSGEVVPAYFPPLSSFVGNEPFVAYSAIGQGNVQETPLENALVVSAIADGGTIMAPHLLANVLNDSGQIIETYHSHVWLQATSAATANQVRTLMLGVASANGTAAGVFPAADHVAAKTGTAEGVGGCSSDWMVATAPAGPGDTPRIAVATYVPYLTGEVGCSETGAEVAGPIDAKVLEAALQAGK